MPLKTQFVSPHRHCSQSNPSYFLWPLFLNSSSFLPAASFFVAPPSFQSSLCCLGYSFIHFCIFLQHGQINFAAGSYVVLFKELSANEALADSIQIPLPVKICSYLIRNYS